MTGWALPAHSTGCAGRWSGTAARCAFPCRRAASHACSFALLIEAALEGIAENASLEPYSVPPEQARRLPSSMDEALALADGSAFVRRILPGDAPECFFARARTLMERNRSDASELALAQLLRY